MTGLGVLVSAHAIETATKALAEYAAGPVGAPVVWLCKQNTGETFISSDSKFVSLAEGRTFDPRCDLIVEGPEYDDLFSERHWADGGYRYEAREGLLTYRGQQPSAAGDPVNHPKHYTGHPSGVECIDITEHFNFCRGNAIKYLWRAGEKGDAVEDLQKAVWYIEREILRIKGGT